MGDWYRHAAITMKLHCGYKTFCKFPKLSGFSANVCGYARQKKPGKFSVIAGILSIAQAHIVCPCFCFAANGLDGLGITPRPVFAAGRGVVGRGGGRKPPAQSSVAMPQILLHYGATTVITVQGPATPPDTRRIRNIPAGGIHGYNPDGYDPAAIGFHVSPPS